MAFEMIYSGNQRIRRIDKPVRVELTKEEAWEILSHCITSSETDNQTFNSALVKFAKALEKEGHRPYGSA